MGVVIIVNQVDAVESEVRNWLEDHGRPYTNLFVANDVCLYTPTKLSCDEIEELKNEFGGYVSLSGVSYEGNGSISKYKYHCSHKLLDKLKEDIREWLGNHEFPYYHFTISRGIRISSYQDVPLSVIQDFEKEFGVKYVGHSISCGSNEKEYEFR